jgi:hypothetical protein
MNGAHSDVAHDHGVWVSVHESFFAIYIRSDASDNLGIGVLELSVSSELLSLLLVSVAVCHFNWLFLCK